MNRRLVKLFGKTILTPVEEDGPLFTGDGGGGGGGDKKEPLNQKQTTESSEKDQESPDSEGNNEDPASCKASEIQTRTPPDQETSNAKPEELQNSKGTLQENARKKPDKILPCPRCSSLDTKFCYFNNYNVNQPRHFCRKCQRYWTAGGTMRNMPVGAGRRKNKSSAAHYRHITMFEADFQTTQSNIPEAFHHPSIAPNSAVLSFGTENGNRNGLHGEEDGVEQSCVSSLTASNSTGEGGGANLQETVTQNYQPCPLQIPCFSGSPLSYPWNPPPAFCAASFPIPFYTTTPQWGCAMVPAAWKNPWLPPQSSSTPSIESSSGSRPSSPLGKHSRDSTSSNNPNKGEEKQNSQERRLWIPKTLRIDDPEEAAKSSIWSTMGIKDSTADGMSRGGFFKAFQPKAEIKSQNASQVFHANPAALLRSFNFQESM